MNHISYYREGYPRPQLFRPDYALLNGQWDFAFDREGNMDEAFKGGFDDQMKIEVPFAYKSAMSGIGLNEQVDTVWYSRTLTVTEAQLQNDILLHLEGCDYDTYVFVNGTLVGTARGAYHRLTFDLTPYLRTGDNALVVKAYDDDRIDKPRGKQRWTGNEHPCWYNGTNGIYKTAWVEYVPHTRISDLRMDTDYATGIATVKADVDNPIGGEKIAIAITLNGEPVAEAVTVPGAAVMIDLTEKCPLALWNVMDPHLYEITFTLRSGNTVIDTVQSYFGVRNIDLRGRVITLNGKRLFQKLVLDQGYWPESGLTPPSEAAMVKDINDMIALGFNGARKHQKVEDERFLYYADIIGYIVWGEFGSAHSHSKEGCDAFAEEWPLAVKQQYNHPCILTWVPFNESWGVEPIKEDKEVQAYTEMIYHKTKVIDPQRPVILNDGWHHTISDILSIHHYQADAELFRNDFGTEVGCVIDEREVIPFERFTTFSNGYCDRGQPIIFSEFGGIWTTKDGMDDETAFCKRLGALVEMMEELPFLSGYCYTQISDVQDELNGLLYYDRTPKFSAEAVRACFEHSNK